MKKLLRCTSILALLMYFIPFLSYQTSRMPNAFYMSYFEIWLGKTFLVQGVPYNPGINHNATIALAAAIVAVLFSWVLGNRKIPLRVMVFILSALSGCFFIRTYFDYAKTAPFVAALNDVVKGGVDFRVNIFFFFTVAVMLLNAVACLTTERFAFNIVRYKWWYIMLLPTLIYLLVFNYIPMTGFALMFVDFNITDMFSSTFVGLKWFRLLWDGIDGEFGRVLANTLILSFQNIVFGFPAPIILAILINDCRNRFFQRTVQTLSYLPHFVSWSILGGIIISIFSSQFSLLNGLITFFNPDADNYYLLNEVTTIRRTLLITNIYKSVGWATIIYIAALTTVNPELYESAKLDGAGKLAQVWHITLPGISHIITMQLIFRIPGLLASNMEQQLNLVNALTVSQGKTLSLYIYDIGIRNAGSFGMAGNYSYSSTISFILQIIGFLLLLFANQVGKRINPDGAIL